MTDIMKRIIETTRYIMQFVDSMKKRYNTELAVGVSKRTTYTNAGVVAGGFISLNFYTGVTLN